MYLIVLFYDFLSLLFCHNQNIVYFCLPFGSLSSQKRMFLRFEKPNLIYESFTICIDSKRTWTLPNVWLILSLYMSLPYKYIRDKKSIEQLNGIHIQKCGDPRNLS